MSIQLLKITHQSFPVLTFHINIYIIIPRNKPLMAYCPQDISIT